MGTGGFVGSSASIVEDFATLNVGSIGGVAITRLPPGAALGAGDLETWSLRRSGGGSGAPLSKDQWKRLKQWEREAQEKHRSAPKKAHWRMQRDAAAQRGILVEKTSRGWMVSLPDGRRVGPFRNPKDAWSWVARQSSRRYRAEFAR